MFVSAKRINNTLTKNITKKRKNKTCVENIVRTNEQKWENKFELRDNSKKVKKPVRKTKKCVWVGCRIITSGLDMVVFHGSLKINEVSGDKNGCFYSSYLYRYDRDITDIRGICKVFFWWKFLSLSRYSYSEAAGLVNKQDLISSS